MVEPELVNAIAPVHGILGGGWDEDDPANPGFKCTFTDDNPPPPALVFTGDLDLIQPFWKVHKSSNVWINYTFGDNAPSKIQSFDNQTIQCESVAEASGLKNVTFCMAKGKALSCPATCTGEGALACLGRASWCCISEQCENCGSCNAYHIWHGGNWIQKFRTATPDIHASVEILNFFAKFVT